MRQDIHKLNEIQRKMDIWQSAIGWARQNGANIRKGKISKDLARVRIQEAGLREQWNELFPDYAFSEEDVIMAKEVLEERNKFYSKLKKKEGKE